MPPISSIYCQNQANDIFLEKTTPCSSVSTQECLETGTETEDAFFLKKAENFF